MIVRVRSYTHTRKRTHMYTHDMMTGRQHVKILNVILEHAQLEDVRS